jgi:predicted polyphosphate/ATP-dependent NAD kinase
MKTLAKDAMPSNITIIMKKQPFERLIAREWYENFRVFIPKNTIEEINSLQINTPSGSVVIQKEGTL